MKLLFGSSQRKYEVDKQRVKDQQLMNEEKADQLKDKESTLKKKEKASTYELKTQLGIIDALRDAVAYVRGRVDSLIESKSRRNAHKK
uniref:Uncharacterized protein n=1 Tax=Meloidogyne javanica TaxID=6303 RepID=A0A915LYP8_MELJA